MYLALKHSHTLFAVVSILFFNIRFWAYFSKARPKLIKIAPHIIDTGFFVLGIALIFNRYYHHGMPAWLIVKLILLVGYIFFGIWAMRQNNPPKKRYIGYFLANGTVIAMLYLAFVKPIIF